MALAAFVASLDGDLSWTRSRVDDAAVNLALQDLASHAQKHGLLPAQIAELATRIAGDAQLAKGATPPHTSRIADHTAWRR